MRREIARFIDGELCVDGLAPPPPREVTVHHHHYHHHAPAPERPSQPRVINDDRRTVTNQNRRNEVPLVDTVDQISSQLEAIVRTTRTLTDDDRREVYRTLHGSVSLVAAMISLRTARK